MLIKISCFVCFLFVFDSSNGDVITFEKDFRINNTKFSFASSFQNNMVLQMEPFSAVLWGFGSVGATVTVSFMNISYHTNVYSYSKDVGVWKITLAAQPPGGPHTITAVHDDKKVINKLELTNVLFGDVWICSGQSNMQFTVSMGFNASEELSKASLYQNIRLMTPAEIESNSPLVDFQAIEQPWSIPSDETLGGPKPWTYFSAACWYFGKFLYERIKVPIGLVSPNWGGTAIESWSSPKALKACGLETSLDTSIGNSVLWNAMIHPLLNMTIKGAIWYQGEANAGYHTAQYSCAFPEMIKDWREAWYEGTGKQTNSQFPFGFVQLSTDSGPDSGSFSAIRWHQTANFGYVPNPKMPNTFMAVAMDLGDPDSPFTEIHPRDKQDVGARLGLGGLKVAYGQHVNPDGPYPKSAVRTEDGHVIVTYPEEQQLVVIENGNFQICCNYSNCTIYDPTPSSVWLWAPITSSSGHTITVQAKVCLSGSGHATWIRYAWQLVPCKFKSCSVYNDVGLPGAPFVMEVNRQVTLD